MLKIRRAFTLIELLVVIAIIAILSIVVILALNPAQLLMQARDSNRIADMSTINSALGIYTAQGGITLGSANTIYISIPDPTATSTAGDQCQGLGLSPLPSGYTYQCAASSTFKSNNGTGWIPVNFASMAAGIPLSTLPVDPINASSSRLYYSYTTNGSQYEMTSGMESSKYKLGGSNDVVSGDGGTLTTLYEKGSKLGLEPFDYGDTSLVEYWPLSEGTGSIAYDYSGNNATGSWQGTPAGTSGYYSAGKIATYAAYFNGSNDYINFGTSINPTGPFSITGWVNVGSPSCALSIGCAFMGNGVYTSVGLTFGLGTGGVLAIQTSHSGTATSLASASVLPLSTWTAVAATFDGSTYTIYINGVAATSTTGAAPSTSANNFFVGATWQSGWNKFFGSLADFRIYNRALSASDIATMYSVGE